MKRLNATRMTLFLHKQLMFKGRVPFPARGWWGQRLRTSPAGRHRLPTAPWGALMRDSD